MASVRTCTIGRGVAESWQRHRIRGREVLGDLGFNEGRGQGHITGGDGDRRSVRGSRGRALATRSVISTETSARTAGCRTEAYQRSDGLPGIGCHHASDGLFCFVGLPPCPRSSSSGSGACVSSCNGRPVV